VHYVRKSPTGPYRKWITDPGSKNGILLNDYRLVLNVPKQLGPEERLAFGRTHTCH
jgi:hypothetical protein